MLIFANIDSCLLWKSMDCQCWNDTHTPGTKTSTSRVIPRVDLNSWSVDPQRKFIGVYPRPIKLFIYDLVIDVNVSMSRVDNLSSGHEVQNGKSPSHFIHPFNVLWHRESLRTVSYTHRRTFVDKSCRQIKSCEWQWHDAWKYIESFKIPPKCECSSMKTPTWKTPLF